MKDEATTSLDRLDAAGWEQASYTLTIPEDWWVTMLDICNPGSRIVELGAGVGNYAFNLVKEGYKYTLLDFSEKLLEVAKGRLGDNADYVVADILDPEPFPKGDYCMSSGLLEHFTDEEIVTILTKSKMSAPVVISFVPNLNCKGYTTWRKGKEERGEWEYGVERAMTTLVPYYEKAGLKVTKEFSVGDQFGVEDDKYLLVTVGERL